MSTTSSRRPVKDSARRALRSPRDLATTARRSRTLEILTRAGLLCYGVLHLAIAWLALQIALGHASGEGDQSGAFQLLARQPGGKVLLVVIIVGLAAMAVWQVLLALVGHQDEHGHKRTLERVASAARAVVYGALAITAAKILSGAGSSNAKQQQSATAGVLGMTGGRFLVGLAGVVVIALGIGLTVYGAKRSFAKRLRTSQMSHRVRQAAMALGCAGYVAKGVAYAVVGVLLFLAAVRFDSNNSRGLDAALHTIAGKPFGVVLLIVIAAGFAAYGGYCFVQSKYRKV